ncbi:MAG: CDP-diacylglycerol--glycerol-3-phosphate 3-phosphatidyltransferase [Candidatus Sumerlaeaceae bacterium]
MNTPNKLTLSRIFLIPFFVLFLHIHQIMTSVSVIAIFHWLALVIFIIAAITDYLDGMIARRQNIVTNFGKLFDPLADKLLTMAAFVAFVELQGPNGKPIFPAWAIIVILAREFLVTGLRSLGASHGRVIHADKWGKQKTIIQLVGIGLILLSICMRDTFAMSFGKTAILDAWLPVFYRVVLAITVGITAASGLVFLWKNWDLVSDRD